MSVDIDRLLEEIRQNRIARGLPPDPPEKVRDIPDEQALELLDRMDRFVDVCVELARLYRSGHYEVIDLDRLKPFRDTAKQFGKCTNSDVNWFGLKCFLVFALIRKINELIDAKEDDIENNRMLHYFYKDVIELKGDLYETKTMIKYDMRRKLDEINGLQHFGGTKTGSADDR